jgi:DNA-binding beta-propeller fold protein YncE
MRKLDRGTTRSILTALLVCAASVGVAAAPASASRGCPQAALKRQPAPRNIGHPPVRAVLACVGTTPIAGAQFSHWFAIERHAVKPFDAQDTAKRTFDDLVQLVAAESEARAHHIVVGAQAVRRSLAHILRTRFRRSGAFQRYLKAHGEHEADFLVGVRQDLLLAAIRRHEPLDERAGFAARWQARTTCAHAVANGALCGLIAPFAVGPPAIGIQLGAGGLAVDPASDTIYVASDGALTMIDGTTCNASVTSGCGHARTVGVPGADEDDVLVDPTTETVYVALRGTESIAVFDARECNAVHADCDVGTSMHVPSGAPPIQPLLDPSTHTLYAIDDGDAAISVFDVAHCNALDHTGCGQRPATLRTADDSPQAIALDPVANTLYVADDNGFRVSLVDTRTCSAANTSRCAATAPTFKLPGIANPLAFAFDQSTNALYVSADTDELFVLDAATCNATVRSGCASSRTVHVRESGRNIAIDAPTRTAYFTGRFLDGAELLDAAACNPGNGAGCGRTPRLARTGGGSGPLAIDERTRTVYVLNGEESSVSLIRADRCNATATAGC